MTEKQQPVEIFPGMTEEYCVPDYLDTNILKQQPEPIYRLDRSGHRYYYTLDISGEPTFYTSVTTFIKSSLPTSPHLIQWYKQHGDESSDIAEDRAHYGTFMHIQCGRLLEDGTYDLDALPELLKQYQLTHNLPIEFNQYAEELKRDVLSFGQLIIDKNLKPIAIEIVLADKEAMVAGAIDLVAEMEYRGKPINVIIDLKSGRKRFYESHVLQLHTYKRMWEMHFPEVKIDRVYNWSPKAWGKDIPTYNFKDQTSDPSAEKLPHLIKISQIEDQKRSRNIRTIHGVMDLIEGFYRNVETIDLAEAIRIRHTGDKLMDKS